MCACMWLKWTLRTKQQTKIKLYTTCTETRIRVSCVKGKYANHLHHTGTFGFPFWYPYQYITKFYTFFTILFILTILFPLSTTSFQHFKRKCSCWKNNYSIWNIFIIQNQSLMLWWSTNPWNINLPKGYIDAIDRDENVTMWGSKFSLGMLSTH